MPSGLRHLPDIIGLTIGLAAQWSLARALPSQVMRRIWMMVGALWMAAGFLFSQASMAKLLPYSTAWEWVRGSAIVYAMMLVLYAVVRQALVRTRVLGHPLQPTRREALAALGPAAFGGYGVFIEPGNMRMQETTIAVPDLAADLDGLKIAQLTDIHYGAYFGRRQLERAVAMANETRPHLAVVTGDFISIKGDPLGECIQTLMTLRSDAGTWGCLGNHEISAECEDEATRLAALCDIRVLRGANESLPFGAARLNLAGVDYQRSKQRYLRGAAALLQPGVANLLLSHNPDVFPVAAAQGWDLTIAGHTHGGQVDVEILGEHLNPARFFTPYIYGPYAQQGRALLVSRGLGTVAAPIRFGAPPEVNLIRLVRA